MCVCGNEWEGLIRGGPIVEKSGMCGKWRKILCFRQADEASAAQFLNHNIEIDENKTHE